MSHGGYGRFGGSGGGGFGGGGGLGGGSGYGDESANDFAGGFDRHEGGGFDAGSGSPPASPTKGGRSASLAQSFIPLTIRQLLNATQAHADDSFRVDGKELNQITIVGQILSINTQHANFTLVLDDGTGKIDVRIWLSEDDKGDASSRKRNQWQVGNYVRVIGNLRAFMNSRNVMAFRILPIEDYNEITYHFLEVVYVHLFNTKRATASATTTSTSTASMAPASTFGGGAGGGQFNSLQKAVLQVIRDFTGSPDDGPSISYIANALRNSFTEANVRNTIEFLCNEAHLYSTIDDEHYQIAGRHA